MDIDETLGALTDLVQQGKVRYIGSSSFSAGEIVEAQWTARDRRLERFRTEQPPYSLLVRGIELDVLPTAQRHGMGILTYSPLAGGWLSGSWTSDSTPTSPARQRLVARFDMSLPENQRKLEAAEQLAQGRRRRRPVADRAGDRLRRQPPRGDLRDHRAAHHGAARQPAARRRRRRSTPPCWTASTRSSARRQPQPRRHQLRRAGAPARPAATIDPAAYQPTVAFHARPQLEVARRGLLLCARSGRHALRLFSKLARQSRTRKHAGRPSPPRSGPAAADRYSRGPGRPAPQGVRRRPR